MMKSFSGITLLLLFIAISGCSKEEEKDIPTEKPAAFKAELDAAKQVNGVVQDAAAQQRKSIDEQSE